MILLTIIVFIIILGLLVFVHELGHFVMAKRAGMRVDEFGFGFPPRIFSIKKGETVYSINAILLGGFVKILGEDGADSADTQSFTNKSTWQRFSVLIAGVSMNAVLAWVLLSIGMGIGLPTVIGEGDVLPARAQVRDVSIGVLEVQSGTPAEEAGLKPGDLIVKINQINIGSIEQSQTLTFENAGKATVYMIKRGKETLEKIITPRESPPEGQGPLGIALGSIGIVSYPWYEAPIRGLADTFNLLLFTFSAFASLIGQFLQGQKVAVEISGPIGIAALTSDVIDLGMIYLLRFTSILSINLAIINALPFPALDGGRILFLLIEKIRGKKMDVKNEQLANTIGFILLLILIAFVSFKDVARHSEGFKRLFEKIF